MTGASVVIPCHGRAEQIGAIVEPLLADPATTEVIVVADRDERVDAAIETLAHPRVRAVVADCGNENGARQIGVENAREEVVVLVDDDVWALPGLVSQHLHNDHDRRVILGFMPVHPPLLEATHSFPARIYDSSYREQAIHWTEHPEQILQKFWAGNFSARRGDLLAVGLVNPDYRGMYHADYDLGLRLQAAGLSGGFDHRAAAWHLYERDIDGFIRDCRRQGAVRAPDAPAQGRLLPAPLASPLYLGATIAAAALRSRRAEGRLARRLRRIEQDRGAAAVRAGRGEELGLLIGQPGKAGESVG